MAIAVYVLQACSTAPFEWNPQDYTVKRGDTLYSLAWRYEKDFKEIAQWNNISPPYAIYPGQRLRMAPSSAEGTSDRAFHRPVFEEDAGAPPAEAAEPAGSPEPSPSRNEFVIVQKGDTLYSISRRESLTPGQLSRWNRLRKPYAIYPGQKLALRPPAESRGRSTSTASTTAKPEVVKTGAQSITDSDALPSRVSQWHWPVDGKVVKTFKAGDTARKGIAIAGNRGQTVKAAAAGKVVYSGNGLISYGNLVIIKHSSSFLSAYAHNRKLTVKEGDSVKVGQIIAHMGIVEKGRSQLHFEIRKDGKPVNPLIYLPRNRG
ncbi:MAG: LysM peptidoglycan-binding domain-containing protein [Gammaproteobacteria bacterium]|nr:LysM peptidoglycan-binding domain-containing protein [Gammaproteobacteria bacterium]